MIDRRIKHKIFYSLLGYGFPLLVAVFSLPWLVHSMGLELFGLLTLAWTLIGFAGVLDFGLGRVLTKETAERTQQNDLKELWHLFVFTLKTMLVVSIVIVLFLYWSLPWFMSEVLTWQTILISNNEITATRYLLWAIPIVIISSALVAVLEGSGEVKRVNLIRALMGALIYVLPLVAWLLFHSIVSVMLSLVLVRALGLMVYVVASFSILTEWFSQRVTQSLLNKRKLMVTGGWMNISSVLAPILTVLDRYVIGALLSVSMVAYYTIPVDMLMKMQVFSVALMGVVFPAFAASYSVNSIRTKDLFLKSTGLLFVVMGFVSVMAIVFGYDVLRLWLDDSFASQSTLVLQWAAIGLFVNALSFVPFGLLQAMNRADITAKINLVEVPFYFILLYWALNTYGIVGAAIASTMRLFINSVVLFAFVGFFASYLKKHVVMIVMAMIVMLCVMLLLVWYLNVQ